MAQDAIPGPEVDVVVRSTTEAKLDPAGAGISQWSGLVDFFTPVAGSSRAGAGLDVIAERRGFRFRDFGEFIPGRSPPLSQASLLTLQPTLTFAAAPQWSLVGSALLQYAGAPQARFNDAVLLTGSIAAYHREKNLKIGLGFEVEQRMGGSTLALPFPVIDWHISDRWLLTSLDGESGRLTYALTGEFSLFGQMEFQSQDIRLGRSSSIASGILRYEAFPLCGGLQYKPGRHLTASLAGGAALAQQYRFEDVHGRLLRSSGRHAPFTCVWEVDYNF
ncbi:MAG TPA: DUF6268 family outer membrane beta-barrel protein [Opitutaceae bacterium]|nr:DUF6268 family outer membrane beta-barrel protein [Opitutaceae bacterium]